MGFLLDKYYFDAVAPDGRCFIGYSAVLRWGWLRLPFHGGIWCDQHEHVRSYERYFSHPLPREQGTTTVWRTPMGEGRWVGPVDGRSRTLYDGPEGSIQWDLLKPCAEAVVSDGPFEGLRGVGYTERLRMRVKPWDLPIDTLHWGRFHGEHHNMVWIRWEGRAAMDLVLLNGKECSDVNVDASGVRADGHRLLFTDQRTLRDGTLQENLFGRQRWPALVFPRKALNVLERKFISRATLRSDGVEDHGSAIHEIVQWPWDR